MSERREKNSIFKTAINLFMSFGNIFNFLRNISSLAELEARLAGRAVVSIVVLLVMFSSLITTTWLGVLAILFLYLISLNLSMILSMLIIV